MVRITRLGIAALTLALSACSAEPGGDDPPPDPPTEDPATPEPTEVATPEASTEEATPVEPATEAVTEEDESVPQFEGVLAAEPYVIEPKPIQPGLTDGFTFWGWSTDGARFAFETYMPGEGAVECDMRYDVFVVDSATDEFVEGGKLTVKHESPEPGPSGVCSPKSLEPLIEVKRAALLEQHGIVVGNLVAPTDIGKAESKAFAVTTPAGKEARITFRVLYGSDEAFGPDAEQGAAYYLTLKTDSGNIMIEPGRRRRPWVVGYAPKLVFFSPSGRNAAFIIGREHSAYEGFRVSWMSNGLDLPDYL